MISGIIIACDVAMCAVHVRYALRDNCKHAHTHTNTNGYRICGIFVVEISYFGKMCRVSEFAMPKIFDAKRSAADARSHRRLRIYFIISFGFIHCNDAITLHGSESCPRHW